MGEFLIGSLVGVAIGFLIGRSGERARRSYKDYGVAKATVTKARTIAFTEVRKATVAALVVGAFLVAVVVGAFNYPDGP